MDAARSRGVVWEFVKERRVWILSPIVLFLLAFGVLILLGEGSELNPFSYSLF